MSDDDTTNPMQKALDEFSVDQWLDDATQAEDSIEIYNNGRLVKDLLELTQFIDNQREKAKEDSRQLLTNSSIADEAEISQEVLDKIDALREELHGTGMVFHLKGIAPAERDMLDKKVQRSLKAVKASEDTPAIPGGIEHPDYRDKWTETLIAKCIDKVVSPTGAVDSTKWTPERVAKLRNLPGVEFIRLSNAVFGAVFMTYEIEKLVDLDFS